ncbi:DUF899 family protein [bacterium]|jgi:predicted dithiol-disulfide oxidoreductase (DUF899 family)|nr:DUF899 family protein [bacterium]
MCEQIETQIEKLTLEIEGKKEELAKLKSKRPSFEVSNYEFSTPKGIVTLKDLFGDRRELILVYNMGSSCPYCTLWGDEYNGVYEHIQSRVPFVVSSPDKPENQTKFAASRGWTYPMIQSRQEFRREMKFETEDGDLWPGYSVFTLQDTGEILHVNKDFFGPMDSYCGVWHFFSHLPVSDKEWHPQFRY